MSVVESARSMFMSEILQNQQLHEITKCSYKGEINKLFVTDKTGMKLVNTFMGNSEFSLNGFATGFDISVKFEPYPVHVIYFVNPTMENIKLLCRDYSATTPSKFLSCHIFAYVRIESTALNFIKTQKGLLQKLKTLKELRFSSFIEDENVVTFGPEFPLSVLYSEKTLNSSVTSNLAQRITDLCFIMKDNPSVRYFKASSHAKSVADSLSEQLNTMEKQFPALAKDGIKGNSQVLILDRSFDSRSPFLHDLSLEAMARDLLDIKDNIYSVKSGGGYNFLLKHTHPLWNEMRDKHIADASFEVINRLKSLCSDKRVKLPEGKITAGQLKDIVARYPAYQKELKLYQACTDLSQNCLSVYESKKLESFIRAEQDYATGYDSQGNPIPESAPLPLALLDGNFSNEDKLRLILLFGLRNDSGLSSMLIDKLFSFGTLEKMRSCLPGLSKLGISMSDSDTSKRAPLPRCPIDQTVTGEYELFRYIPTLWAVAKKMMNKELSESEFPFVGKSAPLTKPSEPDNQAFAFGKYAKQKASTPKTKPRIYIIILGGLMYSEIRLVHLLQQNYPEFNFCLGSTQIFTPGSFISEIQSLK